MFHLPKWEPKGKWEIPTPKEATSCSFCDLNIKPEFVLTPKIIAVSRKLCVDIAREWQILLIGEETDTGIFCYDYYVPKQETGLASVKNNDEITLEFVTKKKIVAGMHSHNEIGCSFSATDEQCTNHSFIKHHIVTNNKHDFLAISRIELPCGLIKFAKAKVIMQVPTVKKVKGVENIEERKSVYQNCEGKTYYYDSTTMTGYYGKNPPNTGYNSDHLPRHYRNDVKDVDWKKGSKRQHAFTYDQKEHGGICNAE